MTVLRQESDRLRWQSRLLILAAAPYCAAAVAAYAVKIWTADTRTALLISVAFAITVWAARAATRLAALTGGILTAAMALFPPDGKAPHWLHSAVPPLLTLFLLTFAATRFGRRQKEGLGLAEDRHGRNAAQVVANLGIAGAAAAAALSISLAHGPRLSALTIPSNGTSRFVSWSALCSVMVMSSLAEATADTLSSELGEVLGGEPRLITTWKRVAAGTDGAVSLAGTSAGAIGAAVVILVAALCLRVNMRSALTAGIGAIAGFFVDSLLGATAERRGWLNNDAVNFLSTAAAAIIAAMITLFA
jgi:uncharacterized protein (TIGR00297 family)